MWPISKTHKNDKKSKKKGKILLQRKIQNRKDEFEVNH